ncbi:hypothetical protein Mic1_21 [Microcystis phage Mic1]|nr:hypothetical protein Mic1_21 [Microcystis phage Mic1]
MLSVSKLESALFTLLTEFFVDSDITFSVNYPKTKNELYNGKTIITFSAISDDIEGSIISRDIIHPLVSFLVFNANYAKNRQIQESLIEYLQSLNPFNLIMLNQESNHSYLARRIPPIFDKSFEIFISGVDYRFHIRNRSLP